MEHDHVLWRPIQTVGVVGMGYVGIPSAVLFAHSDQFSRVIGFQRDSVRSGHKIELLNKGILPMQGEEPDLKEMLKEVSSSGKFSCTGDFTQISSCDAVTLAIQTPFADPADLTPDFSAIEEGIRVVGRNIRPGTLVVLESTVTPGTTDGFLRQLLERESGLFAGEDFFLAHAPERVMVGRLIQNIQEHDRVIGGIDENSTLRAAELYRPVLTKGRIIPMSATAAEVTKTAENTFRDLQIAAANQLALYCEAMGINFYDVRAGIDSLKGEGITRSILWPGAGVGGHCLTKDTYHLERGVSIAGVEPLDYPTGKESLYVLARHINDFMPHHIFTLLSRGIAESGKVLKGARIALLGWSFMANTDDARNTPSELFRNLCLDAGAEVKVHDSWVREYPGITLTRDLLETVTRADALVIFTGHREYYSLDPAQIISRVSLRPVIVDGRNVIDPDRFINTGFIYKGVGRGDKNQVSARKDKMPATS